jgi:hypothetical protein
MRQLIAGGTSRKATMAFTVFMVLSACSVLFVSPPVHALDLLSNSVSVIDQTVGSVTLSSTVATPDKKSTSHSTNPNSPKTTTSTATPPSSGTVSPAQSDSSAVQESIKKTAPLPFLKQIDTSALFTQSSQSEFTPTLASQGSLARVPSSTASFLQPSNEGWKLFDVAWYWWIVGAVVVVGAIKTVAIYRSSYIETAVVS